MSYCRCSEESDVYIWRNFNNIYTINFCEGKEGVYERMKLYGLKFSLIEFSDPKNVLIFLKSLQNFAS